MIVVARITETCSASPSQWEGIDREGRQICARYRWGNLSVELDGQELFDAKLGDHRDGRLAYKEMKQATSGRIA